MIELALARIPCPIIPFAPTTTHFHLTDLPFSQLRIPIRMRRPSAARGYCVVANLQICQSKPVMLCDPPNLDGSLSVGGRLD